MALIDPATTSGVQPVGFNSGWTLTFSDEFGGSSLDSTRWNNHTWFDSDSGITNYEVSGGTLKMFPTSQFTTRHICTGGPAGSQTGLRKFLQTYGYFEASLKMPVGKGCWPAFWLLNSDNGPSTGAEPEFDIMECYPGDDTGFWANGSHQAIKFETTYFQTGAGTGGATQSQQKSTAALDAAFHTFACKWDANGWTYYFDGVQWASANIAMPKEMYILLSLQFASYSASGSPDGTTPLGNTNSFEIAYVRAWQPTAAAPFVDPTTPGGVQPIGFSSGFTMIFSDEFNATSLSAKWNPFKDFGDYSAPSGNWNVNSSNNSLLQMWWNGSPGSNSADDLEFGSNGARSNGTAWRGRFGYYECRAKCIRGRGFFPGFWLYPLSNGNGENGDGSQQEVDITEWFAYENGDWLVDTSAFRCKNARFTIWTEGGGGSTNQSGAIALGNARGYDTTISTSFHTYALYWASTGGLKFYYDGNLCGTVTDQWGSGNNMQLCIFLQLWWGPKGGNPTPDGNTPQGSSNSMQYDYVRVWSIAGSPAPTPPGPGPTPGPPFSANVTTAPPDGATINGIVNFGISGQTIKNAELLPPTDYTPRYGTFSVAVDGTSATFAWDTTTLANAPISVRISAFDQAQGVNPANEIVAMAARNYIINNLAAPPPFTATVTTAPVNNASISGTVAFAIHGANIRNAELLPGSGNTPLYGTFNVFNNDQDATFNWNTSTISNGAVTVRIVAYDQPQGVTTANEILAMPARTYTIANAAPTPPPPPPPSPPPPPGPPPGNPDMTFNILSLDYRPLWTRRHRR